MKKFSSIILASTLALISTTAFAMSDINGYTSAKTQDELKNLEGYYNDAHKYHYAIIQHIGADCSGCWFSETLYLNVKAEWLNRDGEVIKTNEINEKIPMTSGRYRLASENSVYVTSIPSIKYEKSNPNSKYSEEDLNKISQVYSIHVTGKAEGVNASTFHINETFIVPKQTITKKSGKKTTTKKK